MRFYPQGELAGEYIMNHSDHMASDPAGFKKAIGRIVSNHVGSRQSLDRVITLTCCGHEKIRSQLNFFLSCNQKLPPYLDELQDKVSLTNSNVQIKVSSVVTEFFAAIVRYKVRQDGTFASIMLSMGVIEGLGRSLDPDIDIVSEVLPFVARE